MKTYSHVRRQALDEAAAVLEPTFEFSPPSPVKPELPNERAIPLAAETVTSQVTSQSDELDDEFREIVKEFGSSGWIRTSNPPVNRQTQVRYLVGSSCL